MRGRTLRMTGIVLAAGLTAGLAACQPSEGGEDGERPEAGVVEVTAKDFEFEAPAEIPSGWTTFRFANQGEQEHFFLLWRLPEDKTVRDYRTEVVNTFIDVWERYSSGKLDRAETEAALGSELPEWAFTEVEPSGGAALTEPGETSQVTLELEPGTYAMECYVKTPQGTWHSERGMVRKLTVTGEATEAAPPAADAELTLSNYEIGVSGELGSGSRTVAVHVKDNPDGFLKHDINLIRLADGTEVREILDWMDWMDLDEFRDPAPGHSLGGVKQLTAGNTGYLTVELEPGRYAWVSEGYADRGMVHEFTVE